MAEDTVSDQPKEIKDMVDALQKRMFAWYNQWWSSSRGSYSGGFATEPEQRLYDALCAFQDANRKPKDEAGKKGT